MAIAAPVIPDPVKQFFDANGNALSGGLVYTYLAGSTTPYPTYTDSVLAQPNTNPTVLDASGRATFYFGPVTYKFDVQNAQGVSMSGYPRDNIADYGQLLALSLSTSSGSSLVNFIQAGSGAVSRTVQSRLRETFTIKDYGALVDGVTDDSLALQQAINQAQLVGGTVLLGPGTVALGAGQAITIGSNVRVTGDGVGVSTILMKAGTNVPIMLQVNALTGGIQTTGVTLESFTLDGNKANNTGGLQNYGILLQNTAGAGPAHVTIRDVTVQNCFGMRPAGRARRGDCRGESCRLSGR